MHLVTGLCKPPPCFFALFKIVRGDLKEGSCFSKERKRRLDLKYSDESYNAYKFQNSRMCM